MAGESIDYSMFIETYNKRYGTDFENEKEMIIHAYHKCKSSYKAADIFGVCKETLIRKLKKLGVDRVYGKNTKERVVDKVRKIKDYHKKTVSELTRITGCNPDTIRSQMYVKGMKFRNTRVIDYDEIIQKYNEKFKTEFDNVHDLICHSYEKHKSGTRAAYEIGVSAQTFYNKASELKIPMIYKNGNTLNRVMKDTNDS